LGYNKIKVKVAANMCGITVRELLRRLCALGFINDPKAYGPDDRIDKNICAYADWSKQ
jgi:hypothetical protein